MNARELYRAAVAEAEDYAAKIENRKIGLRKYARTRPQRGLLLSTNWEHAANGLIASDTLIADWEAMRQRAVQRAIMYGIGALIESE